MPPITQSMTLNIMTLTPLHVGTGRELLRDYDYAVHGKRTWRIDQDALLDATLSPDAGQWDEALLRQPAADLLRAEDYVPDGALFRYVMPGVPRAQGRGARLREQIKDAWDRPYLPGTSLKGALRSAVFDHALAQNPRALDLGRLKRNRRWAAQPLERAVLGRDPNHDLLRALQVSDTGPLPANEALMIVNAQVLTGGQPGSPIEVEALRPRMTLRATVKLDLSLFTPAAERELHLGDKRAWLADLMALCRARAAPILAQERDWFAQRYPNAPVTAFFKRLYQELEGLPPDRALLQVGWGGGWHNKTIGHRLDERQREDVIRSYRLARGQRRRGDPFPKSRRVVVDGQNRPRNPLGWVLLEMKS